jgi:hypothetical protein
MLGLLQTKYGLIPAWNNINSDFPNYYTSSRLLIEGNDLSKIYNDNWFQSQINRYGINEKGKFSPFPPPTIFIMVPAAIFNPLTAKRIFLIVNIILLLGAGYIFKKISSFKFIICLDIILLSGAALMNNFLFGQSYLLLLFLIILGYYYLIKDNDGSAGILWAISAVVKYFPVIYIPLLVIKKRWKLLGWLILSTLIINLIVFFAIGWEVYYEFFSHVLFSHLNGKLSGQSQFAIQFQSWNSLLRNLFIFDPIENKYPLINSPFLFNTSRIIIYLFFIAITSVVIYKVKNDKHFYEYSTALLTILLLVLSPASATYHLLLLSFPLVLLLIAADNPMPDIYGIAIISIYILIGFTPFVISKLTFLNNIPYTSYYHLWLLVLFFGVSVLDISTKVKVELPNRDIRRIFD